MNKPKPPVTITFTCKECEKPKTILKSEWDKRRRETGKDPRYCSKPCMHAGRKRETAGRRAA